MRDSFHRLSRGDASRPPGVSPIDAASEAWVRRLQSGLTIDEEVEFADWLAADPRHEATLRKYQTAWERFAPMAEAVANDPAPDLNGLVSADSLSHRLGAIGKKEAFGSSRSIVRRWGVPVLGLAASVALMLAILTPRHESLGETPVVLPALCEQRTLLDGSVVELNRGAEISVEFTPVARRIRLERGEASFTVAKDPSRPFVVSAGEVEVRAVGTVFNIVVDPRAVEVVVTEGRVAVATRMQEDGSQSTQNGEAMVENALRLGDARGTNPGESPTSAVGLPWSEIVAGQCALVARSAPQPQVTNLTPVELEARLAWKPKLLDFDDAPLSEIVAEFNRRNPVRLVVTDPVVANRRMTATFRSDNLEGFVRLLESNIGVQVRRLNETEIALVRK